ncbi:MAG: putative sulfate exporter family transporter [Armatimonadetes bacterium]|nr:putative sulfate exporter family transporter [Armatimonadota bacterium]
MALALTLGNPYPDQTKKLNKPLLQGAVVLLGFSMNIQQVIQAGAQGAGIALAMILLLFGLGYVLSKALRVPQGVATLVATGTAICGGSAIAAVSSVLNSEQDDISVAVGTVFLLNAVALFLFPPLGHLLGLTDHQFGVWAGIAIHDIASVVGAAKVFGGDALAIATAVKLSRVLFLIPLVLILAAFRHKEGGGKAPLPYFIGGFIIASLMRTFVPGAASLEPIIKPLAATGFSLALLFIGLGLSRSTLKKVGIRPLALGVILWLVASLGALFACRQV